MFARKGIVASSWTAVIVASLTLFGCARPPAQPIAEQPVAPEKAEAATPTPLPAKLEELPPAKLQDVQQAIKRIFKDAVVIDASRTPSFLVGDFNGDLSQDLAVIVKPADGKLAELNQEFPNWIAREPLKEVLLPKSKILANPASVRSSTNAAAGQMVRFSQSDVLLAIIHGEGPKGWHDPAATQTHLLRDIVGANMRTLPPKSAIKAYNGIKPFPDIYGDVIQQTLIGQSGFLHFTGGIYGWYDPKNYRPEPSSMTAHSAASRMR